VELANAAAAPLDVGRWFAEHGARPDDALAARLRNYADCDPVRVGTPARDALHCVETSPGQGSLPLGVSVFWATLVEVRGGRTRELWRGPLVAGPLDPEFEEGDPDQGEYIRLSMSIGNGGTVLVVSDTIRHTCADRLAEYRDWQQGTRVLQVVCRARGRYVWRGDAFVRP
jgi:hypothetical protein